MTTQTRGWVIFRSGNKYYGRFGGDVTIDDAVVFIDKGDAKQECRDQLKNFGEKYKLKEIKQLLSWKYKL